MTHSGPREASNVFRILWKCYPTGPRDQPLDNHCFRSSGNLVVSNLDRITHINNVEIKDLATASIFSRMLRYPRIGVNGVILG